MKPEFAKGVYEVRNKVIEEQKEQKEQKEKLRKPKRKPIPTIGHEH
jgi:hypothetical protein